MPSFLFGGSSLLSRWGTHIHWKVIVWAMGVRKSGKRCLEQGVFAELCFMAKAASKGFRVSMPIGDSRYDVGVEVGGRILRVQVKSTMYRRRGMHSYSLNVMGPGRKMYEEGLVDFFAIYLIPIDTWYIIPYEVIGRTRTSLHFTPGSKRKTYERYREAWGLLTSGS
jgi:PD-(D/E)XK nuclease superfamily protein